MLQDSWTLTVHACASSRLSGSRVLSFGWCPQDAGGVAAAAAALAAVANGDHHNSADENGQHEHCEADHEDADQDEQQHPADGHQQQLQQHGIKEGSLAHRLAIELNGLSQGYSQGMGSQGGSQGGAVAGMYDTGDEGEQGAGGASSHGARPQRIRKPKQYLGEPVSTPRAAARGSLPSTPSSSTCRKVRGPSWLLWMC